MSQTSRYKLYRRRATATRDTGLVLTALWISLMILVGVHSTSDVVYACLTAASILSLFLISILSFRKANKIAEDLFQNK